MTDSAASADPSLLLDVRRIGISFGGLKAVQEFSLALPPDALYGLIGPNGAGKTTVFNLLTGVYRPDTGSIHVGGKVPTYPIIRFNGPITNPWLQCGSLWKLQLNTTIASGQYIEIDTRPWKLSVLRQGLYSEAGKLARRTRLKDIVLKPGPQELSFGGTSAEGTATATVSWRGAYASI